MKMFRLITVLVAVIFCTWRAEAQVGVSLELGFPQGSYFDATSSSGTGAGIGVCTGVCYKHDFNKILAAVGGVEFNYGRTRDEKYRYGEYRHHKGGGTYIVTAGFGPRFKFHDSFRDVPFFAEARVLGSYVDTFTTTFRSGSAAEGYEYKTCHYKGGFCVGYSISLGLELSRSSLAIGVKDYGRTDVRNVESGDVLGVHPLTIFASWTRWFGRR